VEHPKFEGHVMLLKVRPVSRLMVDSS